MPEENIGNRKPAKTEKKPPPKSATKNLKTKTAPDEHQKATIKRGHPVRTIHLAAKNRKSPRKGRTKKHNKEYTEEHKTGEEINHEGGIVQGTLTEPGELPEMYGQSRVVLMPVDPYLVHVYWEIDARDIETARNRLAGKFDHLQPVLRVFDITNVIFDGTNACGFFDITIDLSAGKWYVRLVDPEKSYFVDLGIKTESGLFYPIARSNAAETPRGWPQPEETERCVFVSRDEASHMVIPHPEKVWQRGSLHRTRGRDDREAGNITDIIEISFVPGISSPSIATDE